MSLKEVKQVKQDRAFRKADIVVYAVLLLFIAILFVTFAFVFPKNDVKGITVSYKNEEVLVYDFEEDSLTITQLGQEHIGNVVQTDEEITFTFYGRGQSEYNLVTIAKSAKTVDVTSANCNNFESGKECVHMDKITDTSKSIICTPHAMKILPYGYEEQSDGDGGFDKEPDTPNLGMTP